MDQLHHQIRLIVGEVWSEVVDSDDVWMLEIRGHDVLLLSLAIKLSLNVGYQVFDFGSGVSDHLKSYLLRGALLMGLIDYGVLSFSDLGRQIILY